MCGGGLVGGSFKTWFDKQFVEPSVSSVTCMGIVPSAVCFITLCFSPVVPFTCQQSRSLVGATHSEVH